MGAEAQRILLDRKLGREQFPDLARLDRQRDICVATGRHRRKKALRMLQRVGRRGEPGLDQPGGNDAGLGCATRMEWFGHGPEIGHDARALRSAKRNGECALLGGELVERRTGRRSGDGAEDPRGMPALGVIVLGIATGQVSPDLVSRSVGGHHVLPARAKRLGLGNDRRHQNGARVATQRHVVEVECVGGGAVDPGGIGRGCRAVPEHQIGRAGDRRQHLRQDPGRRLVASREHDADAVGEAHVDDVERRRGNLLELQVGDESAKLAGDVGHGCSPGSGGFG